MNRRRAYLDMCPGEQRGVITLDDRPERLLLRRDEDEPRLALGARVAARVAQVEPALATAFLDLGDGFQAVLPYRPEGRPVRGQTLEIEVRSEPRQGKLATARSIGPAEGPPRLLAAAPPLVALLRAEVRDSEIITGASARAAADEAEAEALEVIHPLSGGGSISIEPTRALTAIDVDVGERKGADAKRVSRQTNLEALGAAARLLRLKGLGGLIVIDLAGRGHDGAALLAAARTAFAPDNPGVALGPVGRFGTLELSVPRRAQPLLEQLSDAAGALGDRTLAQRVIRRLHAEAQALAGARLVASCAPEVAAAAQGLLPGLVAAVGARVAIAPDPSFTRERLEIGVL